MIKRFSKDALWICKLSADYRRTASQLNALDSRGIRISTMAANVPWYPRDFSGWNDNLALRWVDDPACDYFSCSQLIVLTRDGCPTGLYVEANFKSNGTVVDYGNDALGSLDPGESAILTLTSTSEYGGLTTVITEVNCY